MKRAFISLCLLLILAVLTQKANSACDPVTVVNNLPDTVKVGFGGKLDLSAEFTAPDIPVDSCGIGILNWEAKPNGGASYSVTGTPIASPDTGTAYTISWRPANAETLRLVPYVVDSLSVPQVHYSSDTTVVIVKDGLWYPEAFHYRGAFRVSYSDGTGGGAEHRTAYSHFRMLTYCPTGESGDNDGYEGSLFLNAQAYELDGPNNGGYIGQINIPAPVVDPTLNPANLPLATYIQTFHDAFAGPKTNYRNFPGAIPRLGDLMWVQDGGAGYDALWFTMRDMYNTSSEDRNGIGRVPADLNDFRPQGMWHLGPRKWGDPNWPYHYLSWADYLFSAPRFWAATYASNRWMIAGMGDREAGTWGASEGPTMFAFNPDFQDRDGCPPNDTTGCDKTPIGTTPLLWYKSLQNQTGGPSVCGPAVGIHAVGDYSLADYWSDGAWLSHNNRQSIVLVGNKCIYDSYYSDCALGSGHGCDSSYCWNQDHSACEDSPCYTLTPLCDESKGWVCGDPSRGDTAPGYKGRMLFYDPDDIAQVATGNWNPWDPQPYTYLDMTPYIFNLAGCSSAFEGAAYDPDAGRLYLVQGGVDETQTGNDDLPIIHVFDIMPWESYLVDFNISAAPLYLHHSDSVFVSLTWDLQTTSDCTFATDSTSVASIEIVVADSTYASDSAPLANGATGLFETYVVCPTTGIATVRGRITIDNSGTDCDGVYDTNEKSFYVAP